MQIALLSEIKMAVYKSHSKSYCLLEARKGKLNFLRCYLRLQYEDTFSKLKVEVNYVCFFGRISCCYCNVKFIC